MAQRKSPDFGKSGPAKSPGKASSTTNSSSGSVGTDGGRGTGTPPRKSPSGGRGPSTRPPARKGKSIVNQRQTPWGLIITAVVIVAFAAAVVGVVVATHKSSGGKNVASDASCTKMIGTNPTTYLNELACAKAINGVTFKQEASRNHVEGVIKYDSTPPVGGNHNGFWADCTGTVYADAIANENAVHMLEHGAIWITYNKSTLPAAGLKTLESYVSGQDRMALSPYPNLKTPISLQAWGYQLFVNNASDPRIAQFIAALKYNPKTTPEYGATCSQPTFKDHPSTFGHPEDSA